MEFSLQAILRMIGTPYLYGSKCKIYGVGIDCSGLAEMWLKMAGIDPPGVQNAQMLHDFFSVNGSIGQNPKLGTLIFYGKSIKEIDHVAIALSPYQMIEAAGGGSDCITKEIAIQKNACVRVSKIGERKDIVATIHPSYASIGLV